MRKLSALRNDVRHLKRAVKRANLRGDGVKARELRLRLAQARLELAEHPANRRH